ncbi:hypothetical protein BLNAU_7445 [Blattamonas nauphoetae]|uniref:Uncharacterized protein n=1 Tax=Blattamonas nauphoetae TaxID=2049346 RepID=A0ABQ9Y1C8_9EUKA|nr:hypothetical protein BLNAU_7445 [Blattamonas nauphoetae]
MHLPVMLGLRNLGMKNTRRDDGLGAMVIDFLSILMNTQQEWNRTMREVRQMGKTVHRKLRMGIEDVIEEKLRNDKNTTGGTLFVGNSIKWSNLLGMNLPRLW